MQENINEPSKGLGDDIAKFTHATGLDKVAMKLARLFGQEDCGCDERKELVNKLVPYQTAKEVKKDHENE